MDSESVSAIRDAFLFDVHRQFEGLARWVAGPLVADVWEDGREAVFTVSRDDYELICFTVSFDVSGDEGRPDLKARLVIEQGEDAQEALVLRWRKSLPEPRRGLDSRADEAEGDFAPAMGSVVQALRERLGDALISQTERPVRLPSVRAPPEPVPLLRADPTPLLPKPQRLREPVVERSVLQETTRTFEPDLAGLIAVLQSLPDAEALVVQEVFGGFIAAARSVEPLKQADVVGFKLLPHRLDDLSHSTTTRQKGHLCAPFFAQQR